VVVALNESNRVLMQLRFDMKSWGFSGGSSELGDSLLETAQRELLEPGEPFGLGVGQVGPQT
jgi:8-oxo-dGTP pyrophosphatase MutT (NUDIX family)